MQINLKVVLSKQTSSFEWYVFETILPSNNEIKKLSSKDLNAKLLQSVTGNSNLKLHHLPSGKPFVNDFSPVSFSHSGAYTALMISKSKSAGIDVEVKGREIMRGSHYFLSEHELAFLSEADTNTHALICWCMKEAAIKFFDVSGIDFKNCISIAPFELNACGKTDVTVSHQQTETISINYCAENKFILAYTA
ncbi:MAG TPA: 4'-phosphopantetheinyl transferase superfamily protein [Bacteroidia bacterium]|nr:4'-phosphopantetheinyl transferase superfamily protein [Bacteroidia bacterium]HMU20060.1 4'-phosphopantetheinyl transferase superfamily protein [Bacteroidia bacterium]